MLYHFKVIKIYIISREPTYHYMTVTLWVFRLIGKMTYSGVIRESFIENPLE